MDAELRHPPYAIVGIELPQPEIPRLTRWKRDPQPANARLALVRKKRTPRSIRATRARTFARRFEDIHRDLTGEISGE